MIVQLRRRGRGLRERRRRARSCAPRPAARRPRRVGHRRRARRRRDGRLPPRAQLDRRGRSLGSPRSRSRRAACGGCSAGNADRILAYASSGELVDADERVRRCAALRDCRRARSQAPPAFERLARRPPGDPGGAGVGTRPRRHGRREPGLAHARRPDAALGRGDGRELRGRARAPRRLLARGAASDLGPRRLRGPRRKGPFGSPRARWCARSQRHALSSSAAESTSSSPTSSSPAA